MTLHTRIFAAASFVIEKKLEIIQVSHNLGWLNKLCWSHTMESCAVKKKRKKKE